MWCFCTALVCWLGTALLVRSCVFHQKVWEYLWLLMSLCCGHGWRISHFCRKSFKWKFTKVEKHKSALVLSVVSDQLVCDRTGPQHGWTSSGVPCARKGLPPALFMADTLCVKAYSTLSGSMLELIKDVRNLAGISKTCSVQSPCS